MAERGNGFTHGLRYLLKQADDAPDSELLSRYVADRDPEVFARLVHRHGPMVHGVCRRVLRNRADADDAFQATFLVLARRAGAVRPRSQVGNWLYGVAYRTALEAKRATAVRREREGRAAAMRPTTAATESTQPDLREVLDQELAGLPDVYRAAVALCDLEGLSRRDAALRLGWSEGTLSGRLARARSLLATRLARHGLSIPSAGIGVLAVSSAQAGVPPALAESTIRIGVLFAAGEAAVAAPVAALTEGVMKAMLLTKLKGMATALVVGCAVLACATAGWQSNAVGGQGGSQPPARANRDSDKDRIAQLERERDELLREVKALRDRLAKLEAAQDLAEAKEALLRERAAKKLADEKAAAEADLRDRRLEELRRRGAAALPERPPVTDEPKRRLDEQRARTEPVSPGAGYYPQPGAGADRTAALEARVKLLEADVQRLLKEAEKMRGK